MRFILNNEFIIIGDLKTDDAVLLKNISSNRVFKMSPFEYKVITSFAENNSIQKTYEIFSKEFDITESFITKIISFAKQYRFINDLDNKREYQQKNKVYYSNKFFYILISIFTFLRLDRLRIRIDMKNNFNLLKVMNWEVRYFEIYIYALFRKIQYLLLIGTLVCFVILYKKIHISYIFYNIGKMNPFLLITFVFPLSLLISFLHEFSHFYVYKSYGGKQNEMGFALMYRFLPIFYIATEDMILWQARSKRILVALAGIINDLFFLCILVIIHTHIGEGILNSLVSFLIFGLMIKFCYNINPFAPGSDMYFVFIDLFNIRSPFLKVQKMFKSFFRKRAKYPFKWHLFFYGLLFYTSIFIYIITFLSLITLPFWVNFIPHH